MEFFELILGRSEDKPGFVPDIVARIPLSMGQATEKRIEDFYWLQSQTLIHAAMDRLKREKASDSALSKIIAPVLSELLQITPCDSSDASKNANADPIAIGIAHDLQDLALDVVGLGKHLQLALKGRLSHFGAERIELKRADEAVRDGLKEVSSERREYFREAAELYARVTATSLGSTEALSWTLLGWLKWRLEGQINESADMWMKALRSRGATKDPITSLITRLSAYASAEMSNHEEAFIKLVKLGGECANGFTLVEAAGYAWRAGLENEAKQMVMSAMSHQPILIVWLAGQDYAEHARWAA